MYIVPSPPPPPPPQNRSDDDDDSRIKSRFSFFQQNDFISGSLALKDAPSGQGQCQRKKKKKKKMRKRVCLQPEEGASGFFFVPTVQSRPGRGETKKPAQKNLLFSRGFCLPHSFFFSFHPLMPNHRRRRGEGQFSIPCLIFPPKKISSHTTCPKGNPPPIR